MHPSYFDEKDSHIYYSCQGIVFGGILAWCEEPAYSFRTLLTCIHIAIIQATATWLLSLRVIILYSGTRIVIWAIWFVYFSVHFIGVVFTGMTPYYNLPYLLLLHNDHFLFHPDQCMRIDCFGRGAQSPAYLLPIRESLFSGIQELTRPSVVGTRRLYLCASGHTSLHS